jgi:hypothetical protein
MEPNERAELNEALGGSNAALSMVRLLMQLLAETQIMPPHIILDGLDAVALATEETIGDPRATPDTAIQLQEVRRTIEAFSELPAFRQE